MAHTGTAGPGHDELHQDRGPSYVMPNSWERARQRLELLEASYDAASFKRASRLGVREGWRCLDAGAGGGSFARWLSTQVGPAGSVIATGAYREAWLAFIRVIRAAGTDPDWTRDLPLRLRRHGLVDIDAELDVPLFRGGSDHARFWSLTWQQVRDRVAAVGEPAHVIDQGQAELSDEQRWFHGPATMIAWGRRPSS